MTYRLTNASRRENERTSEAKKINKMYLCLARILKHQIEKR